MARRRMKPTKQSATIRLYLTSASLHLSNLSSCCGLRPKRKSRKKIALSRTSRQTAKSWRGPHHRPPIRQPNLRRPLHNKSQPQAPALIPLAVSSAAHWHGVHDNVFAMHHGRQTAPDLKESGYRGCSALASGTSFSAVFSLV